MEILNQLNMIKLDQKEGGDIFAYPRESMSDIRSYICKAIINKNEECKRRLSKEPAFKRIDLVITVPDNPLFNGEYSIKP